MPARKRDYHPGELSQWQAYLDYVAAQEDQDEIDLQAAIRGQLEPVLPKEVDRELLWSLAYQLEQLLAEEAAGLQRLAGQQQALEKALGEDLAEEKDLGPWKPHLTRLNREPTGSGTWPGCVTDFGGRSWAPHLNSPWAALVLEAAAGESSPRYLWEADAEEGRITLAGRFRPAGLAPAAGCRTRQDMQALQLGVEFQKILGELLQALR